MKRFAFSAFRGAILPLSFVFFNTFILYYLYPFVFSCIHYFIPWSTVGVHLATVIIAYRSLSSMWRLIVLVCTYVNSRLALEKSGVLVEDYWSWRRLDSGVRSKHDTIPKPTSLYSGHPLTHDDFRHLAQLARQQASGKYGRLDKEFDKVSKSSDPAALKKLFSQVSKRVRKPYFGYQIETLRSKVPNSEQLQAILSGPSMVFSSRILSRLGIQKRNVRRLPSIDTDSPLHIAKTIIHHQLEQVIQPSKGLGSKYHIQSDSQYLERYASKQRDTTILVKQSFLCYHCMRVLPRSRFAKGQLSGACLPRHKHPYKRFCIACGITNGKFKPGNQIMIHGCPFRYCKKCSIPTFGRFCTQCNTCGSCLGLAEYVGPPKATCRDCGVKTLRVHADPYYSSLLQDFEELIHEARALINILLSCGCKACVELIDKNWKIQPKPMDIVRQGLQFEIYHFSYIGRLQVINYFSKWPPAIIRRDNNGIVRVGFKDPISNQPFREYNRGSSCVCYSKECGSVAEMSKRLGEASRAKTKIVLTENLLWKPS